MLVPVTTRLGWATVHGDNLADTPYDVPDGLLHWLDLVGGEGPFVQRDSGLVADWVRFETDPRATQWTHVRQGQWEVLGGGSVDVTGRLIGGCIETIAHLAGTPYGDVRAWAAGLDEPTIVYVEACEDHAVDICRYLHGMRLAGWFDRAAAVLVGRTNAPDHHDADPARGGGRRAGAPRPADRVGPGDRARPAPPAAGQRCAGPGRGRR